MEEVAKIVAEIADTTSPQDSTHDVIRDKLAVGHFADTGDDWREGADHRNEARDNDSYGAVFFVELLGAVEVFFAEEPRVRPVKDTAADTFAEHITDAITDDGSCEHDGDKP